MYIIKNIKEAPFTVVKSSVWALDYCMSVIFMSITYRHHNSMSGYNLALFTSSRGLSDHSQALFTSLKDIDAAACETIVPYCLHHYGVVMLWHVRLYHSIAYTLVLQGCDAGGTAQRDRAESRGETGRGAETQQRAHSENREREGAHCRELFY